MPKAALAKAGVASTTSMLESSSVGSKAEMTMMDFRFSRSPATVVNWPLLVTSKAMAKVVVALAELG